MTVNVWTPGVTFILNNNASPVHQLVSPHLIMWSNSPSIISHEGTRGTPSHKIQTITSFIIFKIKNVIKITILHCIFKNIDFCIKKGYTYTSAFKLDHVISIFKMNFSFQYRILCSKNIHYFYIVYHSMIHLFKVLISPCLSKAMLA